MGNLAEVTRRNPDPPLTQADALQLLDAQLRVCGSIECDNFVIVFDEDWQEPDWIGDYATGKGQDVLRSCPSFVLKRYVNGKWVQTAHSSLVEALRGVEQ